MDWVASFSESTFCCLENCDRCCRRTSGVGLTGGDHQRIAKHAPNVVFAERRNHPVFPYTLRVREDSCIFLSTGGTCEIYPVRPLLCRLYPLQPHIKWDGRLLWCQERCPGVNSPSGTRVNRNHLEALVREILTSEGEVFFDTLREYVLQVKKPFTPLFGYRWGVVYTDWPAKERMWTMLWELFYHDSLKILTPRGRLECVLHDLLPPFEEAVASGASWLPRHMIFSVDEEYLVGAYKQYQAMLPELASQSVKAETVHQNDLEKRGKLIYGSKDGGTSRCSRQGSITVQRCNGERVEVKVDRVMGMVPLACDAVNEEEKYLEELARREGRYGNEVADLTVDSEILFQFMVADALELKATAFAISGKRSEVGVEEMREAICVVERTLRGLLRIVQTRGVF